MPLSLYRSAMGPWLLWVQPAQLASYASPAVRENNPVSLESYVGMLPHPECVQPVRMRVVSHSYRLEERIQHG